VLGFAAASLFSAFCCYKVLPGSTIAGTFLTFNLGGGLAAFVAVFLLLRNTFNTFLKLPKTPVRNAATPNGSSLVPHEMQMVAIKKEFSQVFWDNYISNATQVVDIFLIYSSTWLNGQISSLKKYISKPGRELNFILLNPASPATGALEAKFNLSGDPQSVLSNKINDSVLKIKGLAPESKGKIRIYLQDFPPAYSAYRFDNDIIIVDYKQTPGRTTEIPAFIYNSKSNKGLFEYYINDIQTFKNASVSGAYSRLHWEN
jgi:hypothetical protein